MNDYRRMLRLGSFKAMDIAWKEKKEYLYQRDNKLLNDIWCFVSSDCTTCKMLIEEIKKCNISSIHIDNWSFVDCLEDFSFFLGEGIDDMPETRIYKDGEIVWKKCGVLFQTQFRKMEGFL